MYSNNDWRNYLFLRHSWGKDPEDKAKEKKYNHEYWEEHKEEIMKKRQDRDGYDEAKKKHDEARKANGEKDYEGKEITDEESMDARLAEELEYIKKMIEANGGYSEGDMANITKHNEYIMANLTELVKQAKSDASSMDAGQKAELFKKINEQMNKAHEMILDTSSQTSKDYLSSMGIHGSGTSKSSGGGSGSKSSSSSSQEEKKEESKSSGSSSRASSAAENKYNYERQRATAKVEQMIDRGNTEVLESEESFKSAMQKNGFSKDTNGDPVSDDEYRRLYKMVKSENR